MAREVRYELMFKNARDYWVRLDMFLTKRAALGHLHVLGTPPPPWCVVKWVRESGVVAQGGK